ncbi:uncharacterized protein PV07_04506 [Cladophialophora immunda]|uniref:Uncharacterized protein n=1 Tax=Cladophialophora immunda TaxID=569365 RepID=A0A0D1ZY64_9EURO|nr:uncharacterized protein PV07_04506 [Cladophialophora immunda]KIW33001.1 hypothetical protein PV07_04506 [Cladophialophora immunda]OQV07076.1 hypothetical protein CLAIMM_11561 isoform 1 [Cladophialophora immunda]OQV07077.1 hypothetical protein CLAIMM_11561 isoform 2 [Cladophialophora immunda]
MAISKNNVYRLLGYTDPFDKNHTFVSSWALHPVIHGCLRVLLGLYVFTAIIYSYIWFSGNIDIYHLHDVDEPTYTTVIGSSAIGRSFSYFTYLSYYGQGFYFLVTAAHGFFYAKTGTSWLHARFPPSLQVLHSLYYSMVTCFPILVTLTFWCTMYVGPWYTVTFDAWANISVHALNTFMALLEITLPTTEPLPWTHLPFLMTILSLYLGLAYLTRATGGFWVYEWLDPELGKWKVVVHVICYSVAIVVIFVFVRYAIWTRNWLLRRWTRGRLGPAGDRAEKVMGMADSSRSSRTLVADPEIQVPTEGLWVPPKPHWTPRVGKRVDL